MYTEASTPSAEGDTTLLVSPRRKLNQTHCLSFHYNMYGATMGRLSVYKKFAAHVRHLLWRKAGNQGNTWHQGRVEVQAGEMEMVFEAVESGVWRAIKVIWDWTTLP